MLFRIMWAIAEANNPPFGEDRPGPPVAGHGAARPFATGIQEIANHSAQHVIKIIREK
jgi:hypothetical protein